MAILFLILSLFAQQSSSSPRTAVIAGQIRDGNGEPSVGMVVIAIQVVEGGGAAQQVAGRVFTDQDGRFRLEDILPGKYRIVAGSQDAPTYYPGVAGLDQATVITATAGSTTTGVNFGVTVFTVTGRLIWDGGQPAPVQARLALTGGSQPLSAMAGADGIFKFQNVPPGTYNAILPVIQPVRGRPGTAGPNPTALSPSTVVIRDRNLQIDFHVRRP